jgi:hypothetical protein
MMNMNPGVPGITDRLGDIDVVTAALLLQIRSQLATAGCELTDWHALVDRIADERSTTD